MYRNAQSKMETEIQLKAEQVTKFNSRSRTKKKPNQQKQKTETSETLRIAILLIEVLDKVQRTSVATN